MVHHDVYGKWNEERALGLKDTSQDMRPISQYLDLSLGSGSPF